MYTTSRKSRVEWTAEKIQRAHADRLARAKAEPMTVRVTTIAGQPAIYVTSKGNVYTVNPRTGRCNCEDSLQTCAGTVLRCKHALRAALEAKGQVSVGIIRQITEPARPWEADPTPEAVREELEREREQDAAAQWERREQAKRDAALLFPRQSQLRRYRRPGGLPGQPSGDENDEDLQCRPRTGHRHLPL